MQHTLNPGSRPLPTSIQTIVLTGFMGAGKTSVGQLLAKRLGWAFLDLDAEIERESGITIAEIFRIHGEADFRVREVRTLQSLISQPNTVLALGGGAIESEATRSLLASTPGACTVFLSAPLQALLDRCLAQQLGDSTLRPVLADRQRLHDRWASRLPHYQQAHLRFETLDLTPAQIASTIAETVAHLLSAGPNP
jgi:shikimate kinase